MDASERDMMAGEETTLRVYHLIQSTKRREARTIRRIQDPGGRITDDPNAIIHIVVAHLEDKYNPIDFADDCIAEMVNAIRPHTETSCAVQLEQPITEEELSAAIKSRGPNKSPRSDGIECEFFVKLWDTIHDDMLQIMKHM